MGSCLAGSVQGGTEGKLELDVRVEEGPALSTQKNSVGACCILEDRESSFLVHKQQLSRLTYGSCLPQPAIVMRYTRAC